MAYETVGYLAICKEVFGYQMRAKFYHAWKKNGDCCTRITSSFKCHIKNFEANLRM